MPPSGITAGFPQLGHGLAVCEVWRAGFGYTCYLFPAASGQVRGGDEPRVAVMPSGDGLVAPSAGWPAQGEREPGEAGNPGGIAAGGSAGRSGLAAQKPANHQTPGFRKHPRVGQQQKHRAARAVLSDLHRDCTLFALPLHNSSNELH